MRSHRAADLVMLSFHALGVHRGAAAARSVVPLIALTATGWAMLALMLRPSAFDPSNAEFLCFGSAPVDPSFTASAVMGWLHTGLHFFAMGLAMMLPAAVWRSWPLPYAPAAHAPWLASYLLVWGVAGVLAAAAAHGLAAGWALLSIDITLAATVRWNVVVFCLTAIAYQLSPWRKHRFATTDAHSDAGACPCGGQRQRVAARSGAAWRNGWASGIACVIRCGPFMLALHAIDPTSFGLMAGGTALMLVERWRYRLGSRLTAAALAAAAIVTLS
jgi:hypothetical protein